MRPCTNFLYTMITFSSRIASFVSSGVLDASTSPACSSSPGRKAPAYVFSRDMLSVRENSVSIGTSTAQFEEEIRGPRVEYSTGFALAQLDSIAFSTASNFLLLAVLIILEALLVGAAHYRHQ